VAGRAIGKRHSLPVEEATQRIERIASTTLGGWAVECGTTEGHLKLPESHFESAGPVRGEDESDIFADPPLRVRSGHLDVNLKAKRSTTKAEHLILAREGADKAGRADRHVERVMRNVTAPQPTSR
jgi:hypothetical protein